MALVKPNMNEGPFRPISDKGFFPILSAASEQSVDILADCDDLIFFAPEEISAANAVMKAEGADWHLYGDTRWPSLSA
jgi:hypothetical protein